MKKANWVPVHSIAKHVPVPLKSDVARCICGYPITDPDIHYTLDEIVSYEREEDDEEAE